MKKLTILSFSILLISLIVCCHKEEPEFSSCEGRILERGTNKPIANAMIVISYCVVNVDNFSSSCSSEDTIYSDVNGKYSFYQDATALNKYTSAGHFALTASKKGYFKQPIDVSMPNRGAITQDIVLGPSAWLKLHVKAVNQYDSGDTFEVRGLYAGEPLPGKGFDTASGTDYTKYYKKGGNDTITIYWSIDKNDIITKHQKKVYLPALDTTEFKLFF